ncbi:CsbD family protein [Vaginisenegalia massiliensis]|uniref:CsbD family protein n=1 Tax=Vaginisenegalia massiliensis TaxID=2058294 RepID=UPI000F541731|nr:CsbD family protein [Vaginisenegalia massiliensis]
MSEEKFDSKLDQVAGNAKEIAGKVTDNKSLEAEGKVEKLKGQAGEALTDAKETLNGALDGLKDNK